MMDIPIKYRVMAGLAAVLLFLECGDPAGTTGQERDPLPRETPGPIPADPKPTKRDQVSWIFAAGWQPTSKFVEIKYSHPSTGFVGPFEQTGGGWSKEIDGRSDDPVFMQVYEETDTGGPITCSIGEVRNGELIIRHSVTSRLANTATCRWNT